MVFALVVLALYGLCFGDLVVCLLIVGCFAGCECVYKFGYLAAFVVFCGLLLCLLLCGVVMVYLIVLLLYDVICLVFYDL